MRMGFNSRCIRLIMACIRTVSHAIVVNGQLVGRIMPTGRIDKNMLTSNKQANERKYLKGILAPLMLGVKTLVSLLHCVPCKLEPQEWPC